MASCSSLVISLGTARRGRSGPHRIRGAHCPLFTAEWAWLHCLTRFATTYIAITSCPARENKTASVTVTAGDVHQALKFDRRRMSLVCAALNTAKFERQYGVRLLQRSGSGQGSTATLTFSVNSAGERYT